MTSASIPNGRATTAFDPPDTGAFDWRYVVVDREGSTPGGDSTWVEFDAGSPDFHSDLVPPGSIPPIRPLEESYGFLVRDGEIVVFEWTAASDNYPGTTYELEIYEEGLARLYHVTGIADTLHPMFIPRSRIAYQ